MALEIQHFPEQHWKLRKSQEQREKKVTSKTACDARGQKGLHTIVIQGMEIPKSASKLSYAFRYSVMETD